MVYGAMSTIETPFGIRWTSLAMALAIVTLVRGRPLLGVVTAMGWGTTFEAVFQITSVLVHRDALWWHSLTSESWWLWTVIGWSLAAHLAGVRPHLSWLAITALLYALWIEQGFWFNYVGQAGPVNWWFEGLNVGTKTALGVAYLLGALAPKRSGWTETLVLGNRLLCVLQERLSGIRKVGRQ